VVEEPAVLVCELAVLVPDLAFVVGDHAFVVRDLASWSASPPSGWGLLEDGLGDLTEAGSLDALSTRPVA